ncbi:MAG: glycosyltransferase [Prevotella sp.]|nr:glycosyltransferase [Prevotella sp.]
MIRFSIITVTFNAEKTIEKTAGSVLEQTYPYVEHLIIDGASRDRTVLLALDYAQQNAQADNGHEVVIVSEPDKGLYDAMNKGLQRASGDYVLFLNAGDFLSACDTLETVAGCVGEGEELPAVLYGETDVVDQDYHFVRHRRLSAPDQLTWHSFRNGMLVCHQAFYARTDIARPIQYDLRFRHSADIDWCIRVMKEAEERGLPLRNVHVVVANFLEGGDSVVNHKESLKERFRIMCRHYGTLQTVFLHAWFVLRALLKR